MGALPPLATLAAALSLWLSAPLVAQTAAPETVGPVREGRMFNMRTTQAWGLVERRLKELGLSAAKTDRANHLVITKWCEFGSNGTRWLPSPDLSDLGAAYAAKRVLFEVLVSPFVEPARIYVGSVTELREMKGRPAPAILYHDPTVNKALMGEIATALGQEGVPIPSDYLKRRQLALSLLKDEADECLRRVTQCENVTPEAPTPPKKIAASEFEFLVSETARREQVNAAVEVEFVVREDGAGIGVRALGPAVGHRLEASAMGAASLVVYSPAVLCGCPMESVMTYTVNYRLRR